MNRREFLKVAELGFFGALFHRGPTGVFQSAKQSSSPVPSHHLENGFRNVDPNFKEGDIDFIDFLRFLGRRIGGTPPFELPPVTEPDFAFLNQNRTKNTITWIGHSTLLIQMEGLNILTDPVWASRVGPMNLVGPQRWTEPAMRIDQLPELDSVIISHNHYDHFDMDAVKEIQARSPSVVMVAPLGLMEPLHELGVRTAVELDWWQVHPLQHLMVHCEPTQHFSGRTLFDRNSTLWGSFALIGREKKFYFAGDSGYWYGFGDIGKKFSGFDVAALPIGAYEPQNFMKPVHLNPEEAIQAYLDLKARCFIPIHWGTYNLSDEPFLEPPHRVESEAARLNLPRENFWMMKHGETRVW